MIKVLRMKDKVWWIWRGSMFDDYLGVLAIADIVNEIHRRRALANRGFICVGKIHVVGLLYWSSRSPIQVQRLSNLSSSSKVPNNYWCLEV